MTQLLDTINLALEEIEEQLLAEFHRVRNTISENRFEKIDAGIKVALSGVVDDLKAQLEGTADGQDFQLQTEGHENLFVRMVVLKQLLQANIPTAFLQEAHDDVEDSRRTLENRVLANRTLAPPSNREPDTESEKPGFFNSIRGMFNRKPNKQEEKRNHIHITEREAVAADDKEVYQDNGIYSASRELAMLANLVNTGSTQPRESLAGKASFDSRDLSDTNTRSGQKLAQTPEEIRNKLADSNSRAGMTSTFEARDLTRDTSASRRYTQPEQSPGNDENSKTPGKDSRQSNEKRAKSVDEIRQKLANRGADKDAGNRGTSIFQARELSNPAPEVPVSPPLRERVISKPAKKTVPPKPREKVDKSKLAQSPEAIRAKLKSRTAEPTVTGKASFQSKDVDHLQPQEYVSRKPEKPESIEPEEVEKPTGKAVFEAKDLSTPPQKR